jgi:ribosomal protein S18 acetylase RimI-like enzyme
MTRPPAIRLRPASDQDRRFAYEVKRAALGPHVARVWGWDEEVQQDFHSRDWAVRRPEIVVLDGVDVGTVEFVRGEADYHLGELYLLPEQQRRGIGSRLLRRLLAVADAERLPVRLEVIKINPARRLYERHGFAIRGETETHFQMVRDPAPAGSGAA